MQLQQPYNGLSATYYSQSERSQLAFLSYAFYGLVALNWIFFLVAFIFKRGAVATECMLVLQLAYLALVDSGKLAESWGALQLAGKYTFGYNLAIFPSYYRNDQLLINL